MTKPILHKITVIDDAHRAAAERRREQRAQRLLAEAMWHARGIPDVVLTALFDAVQDGSEAPLTRLPPPYAERAIAAWRRVMALEKPKVVPLRGA
jgi:hypothetical protein